MTFYYSCVDYAIIRKMKKKKETKKSYGVALTPSMWEKLEKLADEKNRSRNNYIESVLQMHLSQTEIR